MKLKLVRGFSCCYSYCSSSTTGTPFALFHSQHSNPKPMSTETDSPSDPKVSDIHHTLKVFDEMLKRLPLPSVDCFNPMLAHIEKLKHYGQVIPLFKQMSVIGIAPDCQTLSIIANIYCHLKRAELGFPVLAQFFKRGLQPAVTTFTALIHAHALFLPMTSKSRVCYLDYALMVFHEMLKRRPLPSVVHFTRILNPLVKLKHFSAVISLNTRMIIGGVAPNHYTLSIVIKCYCHLNQMGCALSVLGHFFKLGLQPDVTTFSTLIHGFVLKNRVADAAMLFSKMVEEGRHCQPNVVSFNTLIKGFCAIGNNNAAFQLLGKMEEHGCQPDRVTFSTLIDGFYKSGRIDEADKLFSEMQGCGLRPDAQTYSIILEGLCSNQQLSKAIELLREMEDKKFELNIVSYSTIIDALLKAGKIEYATEVFSGLSSKGVKPNVRTYTIMIHGFCNGGLLSEAEKLLRDMGENGCSPDGLTYNIIIRGLLRNNESLWATGLLQEMVECGFSADARTVELIAGLLSQDIVDQAFMVLSRDS